jgi:hypothetical protein
MMLDYGKYGRTRVLSRASVELMTTDQLTPEQRRSLVSFLDRSTALVGVSARRS